MPSRVFHYFRPSLNANVFLFPVVVTLAELLFTTNTFFFYVNPLAFPWCNGRYFYILLLSTMLWIKSIFISDFSASSPCALQEGKIPAGKSSRRFTNSAHAICCLEALNEGETFFQYAQIPVGNDVKALMQ
jgi:hypothetical protein